MKFKKVLITGATGFIGASLVKKLADEGCEVAIIARATSNMGILGGYVERIQQYDYDGSIGSLNIALKTHMPEVVFHLASLFLASHNQKDITSLINSNILFSTHLVDAMVNNGCTKLVNTGTSWQHFDNHDYNPVCLYAATKQAFEMILEYYVNVCDLQVITLKLFDTYGESDPRPKLMALLKKISLSGEALDMSPGEQLIDIVHVDDVLRGFIASADRLLSLQVTGHERFALSSGTPKKLRDLVSEFSEAIDKPIHINWGKRPYRLREVMETWDHGENLPGWQPEIPFSEGVRGFFNAITK